MRALLLEPGGELRLDPEHPEPRPGPDEVLVHVRRAGVCATDLELVRGYARYRGILGHEFVGVVDADDPLLGGRRVVADINLGCGRCPACEADDAHHCRARTTVGIRGRPGVFAERVALPRANLVEVPDAVGDELAVFAEPLAAALHVLDERSDLANLANAGTGGPITVLGDGKLGLLIALALRAALDGAETHAAGPELELVGRHREKLDIAARAGVTTLLDVELGADPQPRAAMVVDATGSPAGLARALKLVRPRGTIVLKTTTAAPSPIDLTPIVVNELRLIGSRCGDMRRAVELLASERVNPRPLIAATYPLAQAQQALEHAARRGVLKILLQA